MTCPDAPDSRRARRRWQRLGPWLDVLARVLAATASALAIWRALG